MHFSYDLLYVYDGYDRLATAINVLSGTSQTITLVSTGPAIFMTFVSDTTTTQSGFKIKYAAGKYELDSQINYVIRTLLKAFISSVFIHNFHSSTFINTLRRQQL